MLLYLSGLSLTIADFGLHYLVWSGLT